MTRKLEIGKLGSVDPDYVHAERIITARGIIRTPELILKAYEVSAAKREFPFRLQRVVTDYIVKSIGLGHIETGAGMGFATFSNHFKSEDEALLNIAVWDYADPRVIKNSLTGIQRERDGHLSCHLDVARVGAFSSWDLLIAGHEAAAWNRYLDSPMERRDKLAYLKDALVIQQ